MKKTVRQLLFCTVCLLGSLVFSERALAAYDIQIDDLKISPAKVADKNRQSITTTPIELYGPVEEKDFFYEVRSKIAPEGNELVLHLKHSELLIEPSAVTINIDGENVKSVPLSEDSLTNRIVIPLSGESLSEGFHTINVSFNGIIKEGVCVDQETPGNWLTIGIDSYLQLQQQPIENTALSDYPSIFSPDKGQNVSIILPDKASLETVGAGASIGAFLEGKAEISDRIQIIRESKLDALAGNFIVIGSQSEFQTEHMKSLIAKAEMKVPEEGLTLSRHRVSNKGGSVESLFILAKSPDEIQSRIGILLQDSYSKQLTGQQMTIASKPEIVKESGVLTLKELGTGNLTFDRATKESDTYFGYAPLNWDASPVLELLLRRSDTLQQLESDEDVETIGEEVEMVVHINDVPYPIDIRSLKEEENGLYSVRIPIEEETIKENHLMTVQFEVNGLRRKNPCFSSNENRWVYVSEDSHFSFQKGESKSEKTLASFPYPFSDSSQPTKILLPKGKEIGDNELMKLYVALTSIGRVPTIELLHGEKFTKKELGNSHLIFIGGMEVQPALEEMKKELIVSYENGVPDFQSYGFLQEAVKQFGWMQVNPWGDKKHSMIVLDGIGNDAKPIEPKFLAALIQLNDNASVAIQTEEQNLYTNADEFQKAHVVATMADVQDTNSTSAYSKWWISIGFGIIFICALLLYVKMKKKGRRDGQEQ